MNKIFIFLLQKLKFHQKYTIITNIYLHKTTTRRLNVFLKNRFMFFEDKEKFL